jgi:hypothetical protein
MSAMTPDQSRAEAERKVGEAERREKELRDNFRLHERTVEVGHELYLAKIKPIRGMWDEFNQPPGVGMIVEKVLELRAQLAEVTKDRYVAWRFRTANSDGQWSRWEWSDTAIEPNGYCQVERVDLRTDLDRLRGECEGYRKFIVEAIATAKHVYREEKMGAECAEYIQSLWDVWQSENPVK